MDCYICNPETTDSNECELCMQELQPLKEYMQEVTGDSGYSHSWMPFICLDLDDAKTINAFLAGAQMPFDTVKCGVGIQLVRTDKPKFSFGTYDKMRIKELEERE